MEKVEKEIIEGAMSMFNRYGIRSVTMDDVARDLAMSKKTLYKYFENKADLVHKSVMTIYEQIMSSLDEVHRTTDNAIDELIEINRVVGEIMENHNPGLQFQLQKYYPKTYSKVFEGTNEHIQNVIAANIEKGKAQKLYRDNASTDIITYLYCCRMHRLPDEESGLIGNYTMNQIAGQAMEYHIRGLATEEGLRYMNQKLKESKTKE